MRGIIPVSQNSMDTYAWLRSLWIFIADWKIQSWLCRLRFQDLVALSSTVKRHVGLCEPKYVREQTVGNGNCWICQSPMWNSNNRALCGIGHNNSRRIDQAIIVVKVANVYLNVRTLHKLHTIGSASCMLANRLTLSSQCCQMVTLQSVYFRAILV